LVKKSITYRAGFESRKLIFENSYKL